MAAADAFATPNIGAGAWISGLFHVEQSSLARSSVDDRVRSAGWKIMWRTGSVSSANVPRGTLHSRIGNATCCTLVHAACSAKRSSAVTAT